MHAHFIPGIDDGAQTVEEGVEMVKGMHDLGYRVLWLTPHINKEYYPNTKHTIEPAFGALQTAVRQANIPVELHFAAEYFMDEHFETLLEQGDLLTLPGRHVLAEFSFFAPPVNFEEVFFQMNIKGYKPILAHPERYTYWRKELKRFERLRERGCKLQINLLSLAGEYGREVQHIAETLLRNGQVDLIGTDCHKIAQVERLKAWIKKGGFRLPANGEMKNKTLLIA
ncbi:MAG: histidinol phosphatase [Bacteroidetes bacterium]|nr:MAG: histidinol phosphatase [Bacteroidota bacterium]